MGVKLHIYLNDLLYWYKGKANRVYDGDTFTEATMYLGLKSVHEKERFRLIGIQANEMRGKDRTPEYKALAQKGKDRLRELTYGEILFRTYRASKKNELDKYGKYGRWLCTVYVPYMREKKKLDASGLDLETLVVDGKNVMEVISGHKFINVNLLLVAEGLAYIKHY